MTYVRFSTANPLGRKPWNAMLQPGGLGAFLPNIEAIGSPSVMVDRDAANPGGWKNAPYAGAPVPRVYYAPDAWRQYTTPRAQGLGAAAPSAARTNFIRAVFGPGYVAANTSSDGSSTVTDPTAVTPVAATPTVASNINPFGGFFGPIFRTTTASGASVAQTSTAGTPVPAGTPTNQTYTDPSTGILWAYSNMRGWQPIPGATTVTTTTPATPVPAGFPTNQVYVDSSGNIWAYNTTASAWQIEDPATAASSVVPAGYPTSQTYTDAAGNVWAYSDGSWQIIDAGSGSSASSISSWLTESTIWSAVPNWGILVGGAGLLWFLTKKK